MKLNETLHLVASGGSGFDLTHTLDCNVFLFTDGESHVCFDAGAGVDVDGMFAAMAMGGLDPGGLSNVFLTHGHADHSGGARIIADRVGARVVAGPTTAAILARNDERLISLDRVRGKFYPADYPWQAPDIDRVLENGQAMTVGALSVTLIETPGHSADHCSYLVEGLGHRAFVAGDALFADGCVILQDIEDCSVAGTIATVRALGGVEFNEFLPGHGRFSLRNGMRHVAAALRYAEAGVPPPQL